jgi:hypothetical protein
MRGICLNAMRINAVIAAMLSLPMIVVPSVAKAATSQAPQPTPTPFTVATQAPIVAPSTSPAAVTSPPPLPSPTPEDFRQYALSASKITFYYDRYTLGADDHVRVQLPDGGVVTGDTFAMNIKLNRFVIAGDVEIVDHGLHLRAAAFARFISPAERTYIIPIGDKPDRWTYEGEDLSVAPIKGREMPGDAFFLPDFTHATPFLIGKRALIVPNESIRLIPGTVVLGPAHIPSPVYFINLSPNVNYAQNSLANAEFDGPYPFAGGTHTRSTVHIRYDPLNKLYASYEQQLAVTDHSYISASINPLTRPQRQYNVIGYDRLAPELDGRLLVQESAFQHWLQQPLSASAVIAGQFTRGLPHLGYVQYNQNFFYESLLAAPEPGINGAYYYGDPSHPWAPAHPSDGTITFNGFDHQPFRSVPLSYRLRAGYGYAHSAPIDEGYEVVPPTSFGGVTYPTLWHNFVGATLTTASFHLIKNRGYSTGTRDYVFNAYLDGQLQGYSIPHQTTTLQLSMSVSKTFDQHFSSYVNYQILNIHDSYGSAQLLGYPPMPVYSPVTNHTYDGYAAFIGFATVRSWTQSIIYTPSEAFQASVTIRENHDFPAPVPGPIVPLVGFAPYQITPQIRVRMLPNLLLILSRSYYFHFGIQNWDPQFTFQLTK